ncbi:unnamed protein product [Prorocentrum cordatum]|uniref:Uncharacterized protein n=1 Tax=Prorocentrum cordatum TaxID=2364126 RepID=A0ABN9VSW9_9DINO|nr:unnamed protein product [Polarella glacialis]
MSANSPAFSLNISSKDSRNSGCSSLESSKGMFRTTWSHCASGCGPALPTGTLLQAVMPSRKRAVAFRRDDVRANSNGQLRDLHWQLLSEGLGFAVAELAELAWPRGSRVSPNTESPQR